MSAESFQNDLGRFSEKLQRRHRAWFVIASETTLIHIKEGSPVSGAPGQPVQTRHLYNNWGPVRYVAAWVSEILTNVTYAKPIEEGVGPHGPLTLRSRVGGFHSLLRIRRNWQRVIEWCLQRVP
jgi:hypothetical protein